MADTLAQFRSQLKAFAKEDVAAAALVTVKEAMATAAEAIGIGNRFGPGPPVDTGRLRASIKVGINRADVSGLGAKGGRSRDSAGRFRSARTARVKGETFTATVDTSPIESMKLGDSAFVTSDVDYAVHVETLPMTRRSGPHAGKPTAFVKPVEVRWQAIMDDAAKRTGFGGR